MKSRMILLSCLLTSALFSADPAPISTVIVDSKEYPVYEYFKDIKPVSVESPSYPAQAKNENRGGDILVGALVGEKGKVISTFVAKSTGAQDIQQAACKAVQRWKFPKLNKDGKPIAYVLFVPLSMKPE